MLAPDDRRALEGDLRARTERGDLAGAMTEAVKGYGPELYGFLAGLARDHDRAADLFSSTCEQMWKHLAAFRWESSFRVWAYTIARNEFLRSLRASLRARKHVPLEDAPAIVVAQVRTTTAAYVRTEVKDAFAKIRETLDPEDHMLLGLRVDRRMAWDDIATVLGGNPAALRKRFERLKKRLRELARASDLA